MYPDNVLQFYNFPDTYSSRTVPDRHHIDKYYPYKIWHYLMLFDNKSLIRVYSRFYDEWFPDTNYSSIRF